MISHGINIHPRNPTLTAKVGRIMKEITGAWYDPLLPYLTKLSDGTQPVTAVEDPVGRWIDRSGSANHAIQATAAARPTYSQRYNLLTYSEDLSNAVWNKTNCTAVGNLVTVTATALANINQIINIGDASASCTGTFEIQAGTIDSADIGIFDGATWVGTTNTAEIISGPGVLSNITGALYSITGLSSSTTTKVRITRTGFTGLTAYFSVYPTDISSAPAGGTLRIERPQFEYGSSVSSYQRVTTDTDYATTGFLPYVKALGTDDSMTCATGGGGTTGFYLGCAIVVTGGAGTAREIYSDLGANVGIHVEIDSSNKLSISAGNGAAFTTLASTATINIGTKYVLEAYITGGVMYVQINGATAESVAAPTISAGSAGYTLFKDNLAASDFTIGNIYSIIYAKNTGFTESYRGINRSYLRSRIGL